MSKKNLIDRSTSPELVQRFLTELAPALRIAAGRRKGGRHGEATTTAGRVLGLSGHTLQRYRDAGAPRWFRLAMLGWVAYHAPISAEERKQWVATLTNPQQNIFDVHATAENASVPNARARNVGKPAGNETRTARKPLRSNDHAAYTSRRCCRGSTARHKPRSIRSSTGIHHPQRFDIH